GQAFVDHRTARVSRDKRREALALAGNRCAIAFAVAHFGAGSAFAFAAERCDFNTLIAHRSARGGGFEGAVLIVEKLASIGGVAGARREIRLREKLAHAAFEKSVDRVRKSFRAESLHDGGVLDFLRSRLRGSRHSGIA